LPFRAISQAQSYTPDNPLVTCDRAVEIVRKMMAATPLEADEEKYLLERLEAE